MTDITQVFQTASDNDRLTSSYINDVQNQVKLLQQQVAAANQQFSSLNAQLFGAFKVSAGAGLVVNYTGGVIRLVNGAVATIANGSLTLANNQSLYIFVNNQGQVVQSASRSPLTPEIALVVTANGQISSIQNFPLIQLLNQPPDLSQYATIAYALSRQTVIAAIARKTAVFNIPQKGTYYVIPFESLQGTGFNTAGQFTNQTTGSQKYTFRVQIRVDSLAPNSEQLAVKLSLFVNNSETGLPLAQLESALGDCTINAENAEPVTLNNSTDVCYIKVYLTSGQQARVREGSVVSVRQLPSGS